MTLVRELLAVKVTSVWGHWLKGAEQPFIVWTDHKTVEDLRSTKIQFQTG